MEPVSQMRVGRLFSRGGSRGGPSQRSSWLAARDAGVVEGLRQVMAGGLGGWRAWFGPAPRAGRSNPATMPSGERTAGECGSSSVPAVGAEAPPNRTSEAGGERGAICRLMARGVGFALRPGEVVGIVGEGGSMSALASDALSLQMPGSGRIRLADLATGTPRPRGTVTGPGGSMSNDGGPGPERSLPGRQAIDSRSPVTIRDYIAGGCDRRVGATEAHVVDAARRAGLHETIGLLPAGYATAIGTAALRLPAGARWRLSLARILCSGVTLIVLDEPDAGLDGDGERALIEMLRACRSSGLIVIVAARYAAVLRSADRLLMMRDGDMVLLDAAATVVDRLKEVRSESGATGARAAKPVPQGSETLRPRLPLREYA